MFLIDHFKNFSSINVNSQVGHIIKLYNIFFHLKIYLKFLLYVYVINENEFQPLFLNLNIIYFQLFNFYLAFL